MARSWLSAMLMTEEAEGRRFMGEELWIAVPLTATSISSCGSVERIKPLLPSPPQSPMCPPTTSELFFPSIYKNRGMSQNTGLSSCGTPFIKCLSSLLFELLVTASQTLRRLAEEYLSAAHIQEKVNGDKSAAHIQEKVNGDCFCECCLHCDYVRWFIHTSLLISVRVTVGPRTCVSGDIYFCMSEYM